MTETQLKLKVLRMIKKEFPNIWVYKAADKFTSGIPDLIMCDRGVFKAVELKVGKNEATKIQNYTMRQIFTAGGEVTVCKSVEEVRDFLIFRN